MPANRHKPDLWKADIAKSVDMFNEWFLHFAPLTFRESRSRATAHVSSALVQTGFLRDLSPAVLVSHPEFLPVLRMTTCPPIARDRLIGLAGVSPNLVQCMESEHATPPRMKSETLQQELAKVAEILRRMADVDILVWLESGREPKEEEALRAASVIADRLCGAVADPIIRNAQERRQLEAITTWLETRGYSRLGLGGPVRFREMAPGTFAFRVNVPVTVGDGGSVNIPADVAVVPTGSKAGTLPVLIEAKSAGDFTNVNKRRKEEAAKMDQIRKTYGKRAQFVLFLCGYFDSGYLGYEAAEGIDWVWEHRIDDLAKLGL
ncbi:MAG: XamI family restriction endonuclease [Terracidiphilus sp.]